MIRSRNDEPSIWHATYNIGEGIHQGFQPLVGSPMADRQNAVVWVASQREIRWTGTRGERAMGPEQDVLSGIFRHQSAPVRGEQNRDRVGPEQGSRSQLASEPPVALLPYTRS